MQPSGPHAAERHTAATPIGARAAAGMAAAAGSPSAAASLATPRTGIVRTVFVPLDDDSDASDSELDMALMSKYGLRM